MPECYTYAHIATQALMRSGQTVASRQAYLAGANGRGPFLMYQFWNKKKMPDLPALAKRMSVEKTGDFLRALMLFSVTPVQQSYALGYLTHYCTACTLNPYFSSITAKSDNYKGEKGRARLGANLDSTLYYNDYRTYLVPLNSGTPVLVADELAQVTMLLHEALEFVYGLDVPTVALADTFHDNQKMRKFMIANPGLKRFFASTAASLFAGNKKQGALLASRMQPAQAVGKLPDGWSNPYTGAQMGLTLDEVVELAEQTGAMCVTSAMQYWLGELEEDSLQEILGNNNYYTGMPLEEENFSENLHEEAGQKAEAETAEDFQKPEEAQAEEDETN